MTATCGRGPSNPMIGSWFPTGFHGHFRSKSRNDFVCEYRQMARPLPPEKFVRRSGSVASKNVFSRHDNRHSFLSDAMYFEQGLGRRRIKKNTFAYNPELLTWMPLRNEACQRRPPITSYQQTFSVRPATVEQILVPPLQTSLDREPVSTYRYVHGKANPHKQALQAMTREALQKASSNNRKLLPRNVHGRDSVATCLTWHTPQPPRTPRPVVDTTAVQESRSRTNVPAATATCVPQTPPQPVPAVERCTKCTGPVS